MTLEPITKDRDDMKIKMSLEIDADETIKLHTTIRGTIMTQVMRTREKMIHDALVSLGWTPPDRFSDDNPFVFQTGQRDQSHDPRPDRR